MITVSTAAAEQIKESAKQGQMEGLALRLAAEKNDDGSLKYAMGFADRELDDDISFESLGVKILVAAASYELLKNTELDYVQLDNEDKQFIFKNPNDPDYSADGTATEHHF